MVSCYRSKGAHTSVDSKPKQQNSCWWLINKTAICPTEPSSLLYLEKLVHPLPALPFSEQRAILTHFQDFSLVVPLKIVPLGFLRYNLSLWDASHKKKKKK